MDGKTVIRQRNVVNGVWRPDSAMTEEQKMDRSQAGIILPGHSGVLTGAMSAESRFKDYDSYIRAVKEIPWVFASVSLLAYSFATAPGDWYEGDEPITDIHDPLLRLWARPNPRQSGMVFRELMAMYIELAGEAYISLEDMDAAGEPGEMYLPSPARMRIVQDKLGDIIGYVYDTTGFHYDGRIPPPFIPYMPDEIIHIKTANPMNEMRGLGNIEAMETTMNIMGAMTANELSYWQSGGRITGVLETDQQVDDDTFDRLVQRWRQFTADKKQRFKTAILEQGLKYTPVAEGFKGLDYSKLDSSKRDFVLANFGIPKNKLGIIEDAQYKSDEADRFFWSETMEPRLVRFEDHITPLGDIFGADRYYRFERRNFEDDTVKLNNAMIMRSLKAFTTGEIRVYIGMPELDGESNDTVILQQTDVVVPIDKLVDADTTSGAAGGGPPSTTPPDKMPKKPGGSGGHSPLPGVSPEGNGNQNGQTGAVDSTGHLPNARTVHNATEAATSSGSQSQAAANKNAPRLPDQKTLDSLSEDERKVLIQKYDRDVKAAQAVARGLRMRGYKVAGNATSLTRVAIYAEKRSERFETKSLSGLPKPGGASMNHPVMGERIRANAMSERRRLTDEFSPKIRAAFKAQLRALLPTLSKAMKITDSAERHKYLSENFPRDLANGPEATVETLHAEAANAGWRSAKRTLGFSPKTSADFEAKAVKRGTTPLMNSLLDERYQYLPGRRMADVDDTTIDTINDLITEGLRRGYSPLQMATGVPEENFDGIDDFIDGEYRSEMIARTEAMFAYDWATTNAFVDSGLQQVEALDNGSDPECEARNGEIYDLDPIQGRAVDGNGDAVVDHPNGTLVWLPAGDFSNLIDTSAIETLGMERWDTKFAKRAEAKGYMNPPEEQIDGETVLIAKHRLTTGRGPHRFEPARFTHPNGHPRCLLCGREPTLTGQCVGSDYDGGKWISLPETKGDTPGHDFRGNQFVHGGGAGMTGVHFHARLGHMINSGAADEAARQLKEQGGFTYSLNDGFHSIGQSGFGVSTEKGREKVIEGNASKEDIIRYAMANSDVLSKPGMHIGGWTDSGKSYLDVSKVVGDQATAHSEAAAHNQLAVFNFMTGESEPTKAPAVKAAHDGNPDALRKWFNDGADGAINWGSPGDFDDCVNVASKHMDEDQAKGFCNERHQDATGAAPGHAPGEADKSAIVSQAETLGEAKSDTSDTSATSDTKPARVPGQRGETAGHAFHGNRWTGSLGGGSGNLPFNPKGDQYFNALSTKGQAAVIAQGKKFGIQYDNLKTEIANRLSNADGTPNQALLEQGAKWYPMAHELTEKIATSTADMPHPMDTSKIAAAMAELSPQTAWETNAEVASRLSQWVASGKADNMTSADAALAFKADWQKNGWGGESITNPGVNNKLAMMNNLVEQATDVLTGRVSIEESLSSPKQRSFANNIMLPHETRDVTVDIMMQKSIGFASDPPPIPKDNASAEKFGLSATRTMAKYFGSGGSTVVAAGAGYVSVAAATRAAADKLDVAPDTAQAAYWLAVQDKTPTNWQRSTGATMTQMKMPNVNALLGHPFIGTAGYNPKAAYAKGAPDGGHKSDSVFPLDVDYGTMGPTEIEQMSDEEYDAAVESENSDESKTVRRSERKDVGGNDRTVEAIMALGEVAKSLGALASREQVAPHVDVHMPDIHMPDIHVPPASIEVKMPDSKKQKRRTVIKERDSSGRPSVIETEES
jgi:HK97 family phage portal protein